jgi:hypothetical protein
MNVGHSSQKHSKCVQILQGAAILFYMIIGFLCSGKRLLKNMSRYKLIFFWLILRLLSDIVLTADAIGLLPNEPGG